MRIESLRKFRGKNPNGYFEDLPPVVRHRAWWWLGELQERRRRKGKQTPQWVFALLVGQAKRLALNPPTSAWGRSMLAKRGGLAVQEKHRRDGTHPTDIATRVRISKRRAQRQTAARRTGEQQATRSVQALTNIARWMSG